MTVMGSPRLCIALREEMVTFFLGLDGGAPMGECDEWRTCCVGRCAGAVYEVVGGESEGSDDNEIGGR